jgi:hypothetical protein
MSNPDRARRGSARNFFIIKKRLIVYPGVSRAYRIAWQIYTISSRLTILAGQTREAICSLKYKKCLYQLEKGIF